MQRGKYIRTEECLERMSLSRKGRKLSDEHKLKLRGRRCPMPLETRMLISLDKMGRKRKPFTEQACKNMSLARIGNKSALGIHPSAETRAKIGAAEIGNKKALGCHHTKHVVPELPSFGLFQQFWQWLINLWSDLKKCLNFA